MKKLIVLLLLVLVLLPLAAPAAELPDDANTTCPVMPEEESDPDIFVEHQGQKVYLCCTKCKREFAKAPEKYMEALRQWRAEQTTSGTQSKSANATSATVSAVAAPTHGEAAAAPPRAAVKTRGFAERGLTFAGKLHPLAVHFPIALVLCAALMEAPGAIRGRRVSGDVPRTMLALATAGMLVAVPLGWASAATSDHPSMEEVVELHRWLGIAAGATTGAAYLLGLRAHRGKPGMRVPYLATLYGAAIGTAVSGHLGATLIYGADYFTL